MPFLLGYFGKGDSKHLAAVARANLKNGTALQEQQNENLHLFAGYYHNEQIESNDIVPIGNGLLVGKIITRDSYQSARVFEPATAHAISQKPSILCTQYWGRYSGVLYDEIKKHITLVRDPLGLATLFYVKTADGILFATDLALLYDCFEVKPAINWHYFADYLMREQYELAITPFKDMYELQPGMGLRFTHECNAQQEFLWDLSKCKPSYISNQKEFEQELLDTLKKTVKAWVADANVICIELSGGLDSSAVMIALKEVLKEDQKLIAINYMDSKEPSANEIIYAQEVADACNAPLYLVDWHQATLFDSSLIKDWRTNRPSTLSLFRKVDATIKDILATHGCTQVLNGQGGDHVFLAPPLEHSLADFWLEKGYKDSKKIVHELSTHYRKPWWPLIWHNIKAIGNKSVGRSSRTDTSINLLSADFKKKHTPSSYFLNDIIKKYSPAKASHIKALEHAVHFADRTQRMAGFTFCHPLLSQPIVELGLQIPTYQSFGSGYDRIIFRNAVSSIKKLDAFWRNHKGDTTTSMIKKIIAQSEEISHLLLEGELIKAGVIDKNLVQKSILELKHGKVEPMWPILNALTVELWFRQWGLRKNS